MKSIRYFVVASLIPFIAFSADRAEENASCCVPWFLSSAVESVSTSVSSASSSLYSTINNVAFGTANAASAASSGILYNAVEVFEAVFQTMGHPVCLYHDSASNDFNTSDKTKGDSFTLRGYAYPVNSFNPANVGIFQVDSQGAGSFGTVIVEGKWLENVKLANYPAPGTLVAIGTMMVTLNSGDDHDFFTLPFKMTVAAQTANDTLPMFKINFATSSTSGRNNLPGNHDDRWGKADVYYKNSGGASFLFRIQKEYGRKFNIPQY